ncbi:hypothetical protein L3556_08465 [Candidatus Synechococcus calcipolaris G9]|uniref:Uncharacterized protein n=1 Tax=Candidatus Synechococcus calcipolaris G9 TaxID=1497997 RepID=A0ABT6EZE6_9SYNE|nr:hypothetical protein [Candidatus Synechococcus calcipolaris]MDG2990958.1 hypothetical protein [Candidatus Synechococcus calcipolaris G9]
MQTMPTLDIPEHDLGFDTSLLAVAQTIYNLYQQVHGSRTAPAGVAVDRQTLRGHVIFAAQPVLLPHECFVPYHDLPEVGCA